MLPHAQLVASGYTRVQPTGASWSLDTYVPNSPSTCVGSPASIAAIALPSTLTAAQISAVGIIANNTTGSAAHAVLADTSTALGHTPITCSGAASIGILANGDTAGCTTTSAVTPAAITTALNATTDSTGTAVTFLGPVTGRSIAGALTTSQIATKTTGGDGIYGSTGGNGLSKAVATCVAGCNITVDSAYAGTEIEPQFVPSGQYGWASAYPDGMQLHDYRAGKELHVHSNINGVASGVFNRYDHNPTGTTALNEGFRVDSVITAPGQSSYGGESNFVGIHSNNIFSSLGIKAGLQVDVKGNSPGDTQILIMRGGFSGGAQNPDDQFGQALYTEIQDSPSNQFTVPRINVTALAGTSADGSMAISGSVYPGTYDRDWGQGRFALKVKENGTDAALYNLHLTGSTSPSGSPYSVTDGPFGHGSFGTLSASDIPASLPVSSAIGQATAVIHVPATNGVATPVTATFALVSGTYHTGIACELGQFRGEQVNITAVQPVTSGTQAITFGLRLDPDGGTNRGQFYPFIFQDAAGSTTGLCGTATKSGAYNMGDGKVSQAVPLVGAMLDSTGKKVLIYGAHYNAGIASFPAPIFGVQNVTLIRQSGIAYITGGLTDQTTTTNAAGAVIVASDTSFSTTSSPQILPYTSGPGQLGYANAGPDTTTPVTATLQIFPTANVASIYNAAEVINTTNAGTIGKPGFVGSTLSLEPFAWSINTGTTLESPPHYSGGISLSAEVMTANLPGNNVGKVISMGGAGTSGAAALRVLNATPLAQMRGHGGFIASQTLLSDAGATGTISGYVSAYNPESGSTIFPFGWFGGGGALSALSYGSIMSGPTATDVWALGIDQRNDTYSIGYRYGETLNVTRTYKDASGKTTRQGGFNFNSIVSGQTAVNDGDLPNLVQVSGLIAKAVPVIPVLSNGLASDTKGVPYSQNYLNLQAENNADPRITYQEFGPGTDGNAAPTPALGNEATVWNNGQVSRIRHDRSMSAFCDNSGEGCGPTSIQVALPTAAIAANSCSTSSTAAMVGMLPTSVIFYSFASNPTAVNGWGAVGGLAFRTWPTADTLNWSVCNQTSAAITPGAISVNVGAK